MSDGGEGGKEGVDQRGAGGGGGVRGAVLVVSCVARPREHGRPDGGRVSR